MLIRDASIWEGPRADVRIEGARIAAIGHFAPRPGEIVIEARGAALLPGLHDHHLHLAGAAARQTSLVCGPPAISNETALAEALGEAGSGWLRGIDYHESVAGLLSAAQIDAMAAHRPVRIQHRSGRMWFLNSLALETLLDCAAPPPGLERENGRWTGRLFDEDVWLRRRLQSAPPDLAGVGAALAEFGVTGVTDMSPANGPQEVAWLCRQQESGALPQTCLVAGSEALWDAAPGEGLSLGPLKLHFHENAMPDFEMTVARISAAHRVARPIAVHCTTELELVFTLAALEEAGAIAGDRIEHAGMASDDLVERIAALDLRVVSQPHFITERGDSYLLGVPCAEWSHLYRLGAFHRAGVVLAAGSDAPHGGLDPWSAMAAAVERRTARGRIVGDGEKLTPEAALSLYLKDPGALERERRITVGAPADLCLLTEPWPAVRAALGEARVKATFCRGALVHQYVDQTPGMGETGADTAT